MPDPASPSATPASPSAVQVSPLPRDWTPPWPPIQVATSEWILMRDDRRTPAAIVRALRLGARRELFYRVVSWAAASEDRHLIGYFQTLAEADRAVLVTPDLPGSKMQPVQLDRRGASRTPGGPVLPGTVGVLL